jgi:hypothetical protein
MDYSQAEIDYVDYCVNYLPSCQWLKKKCPMYDSCNHEGECNRIIDRMKNGEILAEEDVKVIEFLSFTRGLWEPEDGEKACYAKGSEERCTAFAVCEERKDGHEVCTELLQRLDRSAQRIAEKEIQKTIIKNFPEEWYLKEKVSLDGYEKEIPEINGRTDIELKGQTTDTLYVVELKLRATREHIGQLASYVGWYKKHLPEKVKAVEGILLAEEFDKGALSALEVCPDLMARICKLRVDIEKFEQV